MDEAVETTMNEEVEITVDEAVSPTSVCLAHGVLTSLAGHHSSNTGNKAVGSCPSTIG